MNLWLNEFMTQWIYYWMSLWMNEQRQLEFSRQTSSIISFFKFLNFCSNHGTPFSKLTERENEIKFSQLSFLIEKAGFHLLRGHFTRNVIIIIISPLSRWNEFRGNSVFTVFFLLLPKMIFVWAGFCKICKNNLF